MSSKKIAYIIPFSFEYRAPFNERMKAIMAARGVDYQLIYSAEPHFIGARGNLVDLEWATSVRCNLWRVGAREFRYQHALIKGLSQDLVILQQGNGLLVNYLLQTLARGSGTRTAFFGHGKNFQAMRQDHQSERFKQFWVDKVDWWFAYTSRSADVVAATGFPRDRITVVNNSIDTAAIRDDLASITRASQSDVRGSLLDGSHNVGVYVGGLYPLKRLSFLIEAASIVQRSVADFRLLIVGGGEDAQLARAAAAEHNWVRYVGPKFGREKSLLASLGKVFLMPGLVGLAVLDSFAYGTPMVTTAVPYHSPEIDYLADGENGVIVKDLTNAQAYAEAVIRILRDDTYRERLKAGATAALGKYSIAAMAERFADGAMAALAAPKLRLGGGSKERG